MDRLILWPRRMVDFKENYRLLSSGFIHLDYSHLLFNMLALFFIGQSVESYFSQFSSPWIYVVMYLTGIIAASLPSYLKNKQNSNYRSLGASGGVAAVVFSFVYISPWSKLYLMFIPIGIYSLVFGILYLVFSAYMAKKSSDNVNHDAHFYGSIYGFLFTLAVDPTHGRWFWDQIKNAPFLN